VADLLRAEAPRLGYKMLNNLLLVDDRTTAQIDHVLVDRFGIVVVETKNYHALIRGRSDDRKWTACYSGKERRRERFPNPLRQNDRHREMLHRVLGACGRRVSTGSTSRASSSSPAGTSRISNSTMSIRCASCAGPEVVDYMRARCGDFSANPGAA